MENWRKYANQKDLNMEMILESDVIDEGFKDFLKKAAFAGIMSGAALGAGSVEAAPFSQDTSLSTVARETGLDKLNPDQVDIIAEKIGDQIFKAIKSSRGASRMASEMSKEEFGKLITKLSNQVYGQLDRFVKSDEEIEAIAVKVVQNSNSLRFGSIKNRKRR